MNPGYPLALFSSVLLFTSAVAETTLPDWNNVEVVERNRLAPRAHFHAYPDPGSAVFGAPTPWRASLNGRWKFQYSVNPELRPVEFHQPDYDTGDWHDIEVPLNWQMAGFGIPIYNNSTFPFNSKPPLIDQLFNPVGSYKRSFTVPSEWDGRQVLIHFAGVDSAFTLWVNGREVGYSEGSRTPAEFDITELLKKGDNDLAVEVIRFSSGAWLEDQDFFRLSGIFRDVELIARPADQRLRDFTLRTPLDESYTDATLELDCEFENATGGKVTVTVHDAAGVQVLAAEAPITGGEAHISEAVEAPRLWSAENPTLYHLRITHLNAEGKIVEVVPWRFGFRWSEIKDNRFLVNGKPVILAGVNRHEHSPVGGHTVTREEIIADLVTMKRLNFNAVRTSHYPASPEFYALCDEYGFYVNDEANVESHGDQGIPRMPEFAASHHHRMRRMVERDKNFTSVVSWSLGNESGSNGAHNDNYTWTKENDFRPIGYQRHGTKGLSDYNTPFYKSPDAVAGYARKGGDAKPLIQCEYAHAMGNSTGNMREYWDIHWADNLCQGAFAWDWIDQGIRLPVPERAWVRIPGTDAEWLLVEGKQAGPNGLRGQLHFGHESGPAFEAPWTVHLLLKTAPPSNDSLAFYPLFSKDSSTGAVFLERNRIVFQTFGKDRNKLSAPLPESFFDGGEHSLTIAQSGSAVTFHADGARLGEEPMTHPLKKKGSGLLSFGPAVGTALIPERLRAHAPSLLTAKLMNGSHDPAAVPDQPGLVDIDFRKPMTVLAQEPAGGHFFAYGGYWENRRGHFTKGNFCMNGVVDSARTPHPGGHAFQYVQQPYATTAVDARAGRFEVKNRNFFEPLDERIRCEWSLTADGEVLRKGTLGDLTIPPQESAAVTLPWEMDAWKPGVEYRAQLRFRLAKATNWAEAGHLVAWDDFQVAYEPVEPRFGTGELAVTEDDDAVTIRGADFSVQFGKSAGTLTSYRVGDHELLAGPLVPSFWRGPTDNDKPAGVARAVQFRNPQLEQIELTHESVAPGRHRITTSAMLSGTGAAISLDFLVHGDGQIETEVGFEPKKGAQPHFLPRFGMRVQVAPELTQLDWYGHGPRETYCDRNFEIIGRYSDTVDGLFTDYSRPQENGNLHGVRNATLGNGRGLGLQVIARPEAPVNVSIRRHRHEVLEVFNYSYQLPPSKDVYLNIDHRLMGLGGINSWGAKPLDAYQLKAVPMSYRFVLRGGKREKPKR